MTAARIIALACVTGALVFALHQKLTSGQSEEGERSFLPPPGQSGPDGADEVTAAARPSGADARAEQHARQSRQQDVAFASGADRADGGSGDATRAARTETVRNMRLLKEIRDAGFVCYDLLDVESAAEDAGAWTAYCEAMRYFVSGDGSGSFKVEPMPAVDSGPPPAFGPGSEGSGRRIYLVPSEDIGPFPDD